MRTKVKKDPSQQALTRMLDAFAQELVDASDEEVLEAAKDLGMNPGMRGSAAFAGLFYPAPGYLQLSDFFDLEALKRLPALAGRDRVFSERAVKPKSVKPKSRSHRSGRPRLSTERKPSNGK